jgi:hypothetical protein
MWSRAANRFRNAYASLADNPAIFTHQPRNCHNLKVRLRALGILSGQGIFDEGIWMSPQNRSVDFYGAGAAG